jgi:predicted thioesterase
MTGSEGLMEDKKGISVGKTATATASVTVQNTAKAIGSGSLDVFATPMMVALMERAACECLAEALEPGHSSVGTSVDIEHIAASPLGAVITATATVADIDGRKIEFEVAANDSKGEIGHGKHTRVIVNVERFMAKAR